MLNIHRMENYLPSAEATRASSAKSIFNMIDEGLYKSQADKYRAFRVLTSDLGKVFFTRKAA